MYTCVCVCVRMLGERELSCIHVYVFVLRGQERESCHVYMCMCLEYRSCICFYDFPIEY
jgi:hypothetical protein